MQCRFENRLAGQSLQLLNPCRRIEARSADALAEVFDAIEQERLAGRWIALLLDYELGEWLLPEAGLPALDDEGAGAKNGTKDSAPRLVALSFARAQYGACWAGGSDAGIASIAPRLDRRGYVERIEAIRGEIAVGDYYQLNFTHPLDVTLQGEPAALYRRIVARHPVAHAAYIEDAARIVLSFSPELFLRRDGGRLVTRPMKGTAPRHPDPVEDQRLADELRASDKNRAENLMIVDLLRNDLGKLARPGSVKVEQLFTLEQYPSVWAMTSTVSADAPDASLMEILTALFPCGSVTGAPKIAAMRRIKQLEIAPRGLYCGSVGWLAPSGDFSLNVAIRTLVLQNGVADGACSSRTLGVYAVGGGIVHDSDAQQEWQECLWKARILDTAILDTAR